MNAFLIEVDATSHQTGRPDVTTYGPFANADEARQYGEKYELGTNAESQGGYSDLWVVSDDSVTWSPEAYAKEHEAEWGDPSALAEAGGGQLRL